MNAPPPTARQLPSVLVTALVTVLLALQWWMGVSATEDTCSTTDELAHVTGGLSYWKFKDFRLQPENGNLPQRIAALPWLLASARMDTTDAKSWGTSNVWIVGHRLFYESGNNTDYLLLLSRATIALTGVGVGLLIFFWSRSLWGDAGGLVSLGLYAFCPNFLANAPLATSDVTMTLGLLASCWAFWRQTRRFDWKTGLASVGIVAVTSAAKLSFVGLLPMFGLMLVVRLWSDEPLVVALGTVRTLATWREKLRVFIVVALVHAAAMWIAIWACFDFRYSPVGPGMPEQLQFFAAWEIVMPAHGFWHYFFSVSRGVHLLPEAFLQGFAYFLYAAAERGAFLNGEYSNTGWLQFFPYAFVVKTPWPQLLAFALVVSSALGAWWRAAQNHALWVRIRGDLYRVAPLVILFAVYWAFSLTSHLNIGLRHILPTYPVLFIGAGLLARPAARRWLGGIAAVLVFWLAAESINIRPHYLAYFNRLGGGPENGWRHLVDSSLDWGQDLPGLAAWLKRERRPREKVYVSYTGSGDIDYEGIRGRELAFIYNFDKPRTWFELGPGLYCVSATMLQSTYNGWRGPWTLEKERNYVALRKIIDTPAATTVKAIQERAVQLNTLDQLRMARLNQYLRLRRPDGVVGYSIFVYRLSTEEVQAAVYGSMVDLASAMERAITTHDN